MKVVLELDVVHDDRRASIVEARKLIDITRQLATHLNKTEIACIGCILDKAIERLIKEEEDGEL